MCTAHLNAGVTTAALTDAQIWLEVQYLGTSDEADWTLVDDHRVITNTAAAQTTDSASTWTGITEDFKQKLEVTVTVNETGQYRARVCVGLASITSASSLYIDPKVTVS